jgi:transposase-like protein
MNGHPNREACDASGRDDGRHTVGSSKGDFDQTGKERLRSTEEKKRIVEETMAKGPVVARVAQAHGVHVRQIYDWRKEYRTEKQRAKRGRGVNLLPVDRRSPVNRIQELRPWNL